MYYIGVYYACGVVVIRRTLAGSVWHERERKKKGLRGENERRMFIAGPAILLSFTLRMQKTYFSWSARVVRAVSCVFLWLTGNLLTPLAMTRRGPWSGTHSFFILF